MAESNNCIGFLPPIHQDAVSSGGDNRAAKAVPPPAPPPGSLTSRRSSVAPWSGLLFGSPRDSPEGTSRIYTSPSPRVKISDGHTINSRPGLKSTPRNDFSGATRPRKGLYNASMDPSKRSSMPNLLAANNAQSADGYSPRASLPYKLRNDGKRQMSFHGSIPAANSWSSSQEPSPRTKSNVIVPPLALNKLSLRKLSEEPNYFSARYSSRTVTVPELSNKVKQAQNQKFKSALSGLATATLNPNTSAEDRLRSENFQKWAAAEGLDPRGRDLTRAKRAMGLSSLPASPRYLLSFDAPPTARRSSSSDGTEGDDSDEDTSRSQEPQIIQKQKLMMQNMDVPPPKHLPPENVGTPPSSAIHLSAAALNSLPHGGYDLGESSDDESVDPELYDKIVANIENASCQPDIMARLKDKTAHNAKVLQRSKEIEAKNYERRKFAADRSRRIAENAENQRHYNKQCDRVKKLAPILSLLSKMGCLASQLQERRAEAEYEQSMLASAILLQNIFRGYRNRRDYMRRRNAAVTIQSLFRNILVWRIRLWIRIRSNAIVSYLRDVKEMGEFSTVMKLAVSRIVRERRRNSQMKNLSGAITRTVMLGQWTREERRHMTAQNPFTSVQEMMGDGTGSSDTSQDTSSDVADDSASCSNEREENDNQDSPDNLESPGQDSSDDKSAANDGNNPSNFIPLLVKIIVIEAFKEYQSEQYTRVVGIYWHRLTVARKLKRERMAKQMKNIFVTSRSKSARERQTEPVLFPKPRSCRMVELKAMMQQAAQELILMEREGCWNLHDKRDFVPSGGDASILTEAELQRVSEVRERLKLKFFLSNVSVKVGLMTKTKVGE